MEGAVLPADFGLRLPVTGPLAKPSSIANCAGLAEDLGFSSVWVNDITHWTEDMQNGVVYSGSAEVNLRSNEPVTFEAVTTLAHVAGFTESIRLGTSVLCVPLRNPILLGKQLATLDVLSGGRVVVGAGLGAIHETTSDYELFDVPRHGRYERMEEYLVAMRDVWAGCVPERVGKFVQHPETQMYPTPVQSPLPIWFGGKGPRAIEIVANLADGWLPSWLDLDGYRCLMPQVRKLLDQKGRSLDSLVVAKDCYVLVAETTEKANAAAEQTIELLCKGRRKEERETMVGSVLVGSTLAFTEMASEYVDLGVEHFEMKLMYLSEEHMHEQMEMLADGLKLASPALKTDMDPIKHEMIFRTGARSDGD